MLGISRERQLIPGRIEPLPRPGCSLHKYKNKIKEKNFFFHPFFPGAGNPFRGRDHDRLMI